MSNLETWINPVKKIGEPVKVVISDRFVDKDTGEPQEWTLTPLTAKRVDEIQEVCMKKEWNARINNYTKELDPLKYLNGLAAETVTDPDLRDPKIQAYYGTKSAVDTLVTMLFPSEKNKLLEEINKIYELNPAVFEDMKKDAKNA